MVGCHHPFACTRFVQHRRSTILRRNVAGQANVHDTTCCSASRRAVILAAPLLPALLAPAQQSAALTVADVTPAVAAPGQLPAREAAVVSVYERSVASVVNIFDVALQGRVLGGGSQVELPEGNGTGLVWDEDGHVVTNWHVLQTSLSKLDSKALAQQPKVAQVLVLQENGTQEVFPAQIVGADKARDLAVLQIDADSLRPAVLGSSSSVRVGQQSLAIGNPFGFDHTLTTGVISALQRGVRSEVTGETLNDCIQTDAALNPGNSGGPLLNAAGEVIGINTQIFSANGSSAGLGFAIPIDTVKTIVPQLIKYGRVKRPSLNVQFASEEVSGKLGIKLGAMIQFVDDNGAASKAGLQPIRRTFGGILPGDVLVGINGKQVRSRADVSKVLDSLQIGDTASVKLQRFESAQDPKDVTVEVVLGEEK